MSTIGFIVFAIVFFLMGGCSTIPQAPQKPISLRISAPSANVDVEFARALQGCQQVLTGFERQARAAQQTDAWLQSAAAAAGAFGPVAIVKGMAQSVVATFSALSGFLVGERSIIQQTGLDMTTALMTRASIMSAMSAGLTGYYAARQEVPMVRVKVEVEITKLRVACIAYAIADPNSPPIDVQDGP